jgi:hypothetical protein
MKVFKNFVSFGVICLLIWVGGCSHTSKNRKLTHGPETATGYYELNADNTYIFVPHESMKCDHPDFKRIIKSLKADTKFAQSRQKDYEETAKALGESLDKARLARNLAVGAAVIAVVAAIPVALYAGGSMAPIVFGMDLTAASTWHVVHIISQTTMLGGGGAVVAGLVENDIDDLLSQDWIADIPNERYLIVTALDFQQALNKKSKEHLEADNKLAIEEQKALEELGPRRFWKLGFDDYSYNDVRLNTAKRRFEAAVEYEEWSKTSLQEVKLVCTRADLFYSRLAEEAAQREKMEQKQVLSERVASLQGQLNAAQSDLIEISAKHGETKRSLSVSKQNKSQLELERADLNESIKLLTEEKERTQNLLDIANKEIIKLRSKAEPTNDKSKNPE